MEQSGKNTVKAVGFMMMITLVGKLLGLVREQLLAANYSIGAEATAFMTASRIPRTFFDAVFASAISASFIPIFNEYLEKKGKEEAFRLSNIFVTAVGVITCMMTVLGMVFAQPITWLFADGFLPETAKTCAEFLRILFPTVVFTGVAFSFVGILQSLDEFTIPAAMSIVSNAIIILYYLFFDKYFGIYGLTIAFLIGWAMQAAIQVPALWKKGYRFRFDFHFQEEGMKKIGRLMLPIMVSTWIQPINIVINTKFASHIHFENYPDAPIPTIEYANTLYTIIVGVFVLSIANVIFPKMARLTTNKAEEDLGETVSVTIKAMLFLLLPMMFGLMILSEPVVRLVYERGDFGTFATKTTARALFFFSLGMVGFGIQNILSRVFYAKQDGKTPFYSGLISIAVNIILCFLLVEKMDVGGLAFASAISSVVSAVFLLIPLYFQHKTLFSKKMIKDLLKMIFSAGVMAIAAVICKNGLLAMEIGGFLENIIVVAVTAAVGGVVYMICCYALGVSESKMVVEMGKGTFQKVFKK